MDFILVDAVAAAGRLLLGSTILGCVRGVGSVAFSLMMLRLISFLFYLVMGLCVFLFKLRPIQNGCYLNFPDAAVVGKA